MLSELLQKNNPLKILHELLQIDRDFLQELKSKKCPHCGGPLHESNYKRKPCGIPKNIEIPEKYLIRYSLCCGHCRKRCMPPSCRFMGRRVYWQWVIILIITIQQEGKISLKKLCDKFKVQAITIYRWREYFQEIFPATKQWQRLRGLVGVEIKDTELPGTLLMYFINKCKNGVKGIIQCIKFLVLV